MRECSGMSPERVCCRDRLSYASTRITSVSGRTPSCAIASAAGCVSIAAVTASMRSWNAFRAAATKPTGAVVRHGDENVAFIIGATGSDRLGLVLAPVGMQTQEEVVTKNLTHGREDWLPGAEGELDDCVEVTVLELPDLDRGVSHGLTLTRRRMPLGGPACGNVTRRDRRPSSGVSLP